jgi:hypothetical protein
MNMISPIGSLIFYTVYCKILATMHYISPVKSYSHSYYQFWLSYLY